MTMKALEKINEVQENEYVAIPLVDIYETETEYVIKADMPGIRKEDIEIELNNNRLEIRGKGQMPDDGNLKYAEFKLEKNLRTFKVGNDIDSDKIEAHVKEGVLILTLNKKEELKPRRIEVKAS